MKDGTDLLFVYGSLRRDSAHPMARLLADGADYLGSATTAGLLYRIDEFPGLVPCDDPARQVGGDLYRLKAPQELLPLLDEYEECTAHYPQPHEYRREMAMVRHEGRNIGAWIYFYNRPADGLDIIGEA